MPSIGLYADIDTIGGAPVFYERGHGDIVRFFYDDYYYLVDKHCEFKAIERVARYDFQRQVFLGDFKDFDNWGRAVLDGAYVDGLKHGSFRAYHPNGQLKWHASYMHGALQDTVDFFYPDGKPLLKVGYNEGRLRILSFWDQRGRQRVTDGKGAYEFPIRVDNYNEFGYVRYNRKGKLVDGRPHGRWTIEYIFADGKKKAAGYEYYHKGRFVRGYELYTDEVFFDVPRYRLLPIDFSNRSEVMIIKRCTIDDYTGFTGFLAEYLSEYFDGMVEEMTQPVKIAFSLVVKDNGELRDIKMESTFDIEQYADLLLQALDGVAYWLPSYAEGQYIEDSLTVTMEAFPDAQSGKVRFYEVTIQREEGI